MGATGTAAPTAAPDAALLLLPMLLLLLLLLVTPPRLLPLSPPPMRRPRPLLRLLAWLLRLHLLGRLSLLLPLLPRLLWPLPRPGC